MSGNYCDKHYFHTQWAALYKSLHAASLEAFSIFFERPAYKRSSLTSTTMWPCQMTQFEMLKMFELRGAFVPCSYHPLNDPTYEEPESPYVDLRRDSLLIANDFLPPNIKHFVSTPDIIAAADIGGMPRFNIGVESSQHIMARALEALLRKARTQRPNLRTVTVPSIYFEPITMITLQNSPENNGMQHIARSRKDKVEEVQY
jgi:hypothetical protein